jgi:hypothetical protein
VVLVRPERDAANPALSDRLAALVRGSLVEAKQAEATRLGRTTVGRVAYVLDPVLTAVVDQWPRRFSSERARALGISAMHASSS